MQTKKALPRWTAAALLALANAAASQSIEPVPAQRTPALAATSAARNDRLTAQAAPSARSSDGAQVLEPVTVRGEAQKSLTTPSIEQAERELRFTPGGASVVDPKTYETGRSSTLSDALGYAPGAFGNRGSAPRKRASRSAARASSA